MNPQNPSQPDRPYDTFHMGRSGMDLYSNDVGADFVHIQSFAAYVGGSPTNMSVGCRRLGLKSALLTAFGEEPAGDFVVHFLTEDEINAAMLTDPRAIRLTHSQISDARVSGNTADYVAGLLERGPAVVVEKRGEAGRRPPTRSPSTGRGRSAC